MLDAHLDVNGATTAHYDWLLKEWTARFGGDDKDYFEDVLDWMRTHTDPGDIHTEEALCDWARDNGFIPRAEVRHY